MTNRIILACPRCHALLEDTAADELICAADDLHFQCIDGIWRFLLPKRSAPFERFIHEYEIVRRAEGRGSRDPAYYRALPYHDLSGNMSADWRIRAASFDMLLQKIHFSADHLSRSLRVLDLGAGNGWLSNRLAQRGYSVAAVDLITNEFDGLGCYRYYESAFVPVQAEFDQLPFQDGSADLIIFNASLHYSVNIPRTLEESLRVLTKKGELIVLDSPVYRDASSGARMVQERERQFTQQYGFPSNALPSQGYLTYQLLSDLETSLDLKWQFYTPFYGIRWVLRPLKALLSGGREPAKFHLITGTKN